jgi:reactive intermediate/imine deaminase
VPIALAVRAGDVLYLSGQMAMDAEGKIVGDDVGAQTHFILEQISRNLKGLGSSLGQVIKVMVWLADLDDFAAFNEAYRRHFSAGLPARSTVGARLYQGALVEIEVQAWVGPATAGRASEVVRPQPKRPGPPSESKPY